MLGGLALGGLLGYLFGGNGLVGILLLALLAIGAVLLFARCSRAAAAQSPQPVQYAGHESGDDRGAAACGKLRGAVDVLGARFPAGFDAAGIPARARR